MSMFDVPAQNKLTSKWRFDAPLSAKSWKVGLIVGPSGSGKSIVGKELFGDLVDVPIKWAGGAVVDDFPPDVSIETISKTCSAVGFNTVPSWLKPYRVLSNGERFRVDLARRLLEGDGLTVVDEFTSVVDRQVAQIASHAIQKYVRKTPGRQFVAIACHEDVEAWLNPDWVIRPNLNHFAWRHLQPRPRLECEIRKTPYSTWNQFAPFHYLTSKLNKSAVCYELRINDRLAAFSGVLHFPHPKKKNLKRLSRTVVLPDFQGVGAVFALNDRLAAAYKSAGFEFRTYPAHPSFVRSFARSSVWKMLKKPGTFTKAPTSGTKSSKGQGLDGGRPCAVFKYVGQPNHELASELQIAPFKRASS